MQYPEKTTPLKFGYGLILVLLIAVIPVFSHLDHMPLEAWDEARLANSALEMRQSGNWLVTTYNGLPDMWSTKPPLAIWLQVFSTSIFGDRELALRLPSALAALFTCLLLYWFIGRKLGYTALGVLAVFVLLTSEGYVVTHGIRTADYDSLLVFFTTAYTCFLFWYLETGRQQWLYGFFAALTFAVLTKGIAGLLLTPGLFFYALTRRQTLTMLRNPAFYLGLGGFLIIALGFYLLREHYNPGYIAAVQENELGGRFNSALEHHEGDGWYYLRLIVDEQLTYWYLLVPCGIAVGLAAKDELLKRLTLLLSLTVLSFIIVLSIAGTKLRWYSLPAFPLLAVLCALVLWLVVHHLASLSSWKDRQQINLLPVIFLILIGVKPFQKIQEYVEHPKAAPGMDLSYNLGAFLQANLNGQRNDTAVRLFIDQEEQNVIWYWKALSAKGKGFHKTELRELKPGGLVSPYSAYLRHLLDSAYYMHQTDEYEGTNIYRIDSLRKPADTLSTARPDEPRP